MPESLTVRCENEPLNINQAIDKILILNIMYIADKSLTKYFQGEAKFLTGGIVHDLQFLRLIRCDSVTDG